LNFILPKIYPITDTVVSRISHAEQVTRLIEGGARFIQLREKSASPRDFYEAAEDAFRAAAKSGGQIIINDRVDLAMALNAGGVHLGQDDLPPEAARKILGRDAIIGYSTHSVDQARHALTLPVNYIAIGPIFETATKKDQEKVVGLDALRAVRRAIGSFPLVAIGGINGSNLKAVLAAGADSVALIGGLLAEPESLANRFRELSLHASETDVV
jgi:thiamine-phosphate pyrophosphorylase